MAPWPWESPRDSSPLPWSLLLLMLILPLLKKVFQSLISMIDLLSFFLSLIPPTLLPPALVLHWLSLQVQKNLCSSCASVFGVWENHSLHWVTLVQKKVKVFTGTSLVRWWVKVCTGSLLHQEVSEDPHRDCQSITCTVRLILER